MSTIVTIQASDQITNSRADINTNFSNLNTDKFETSNVDTDTTLAANSDTKVASQKAVKSYVDTQGGANASTTVRGVVEEATLAEIASGAATGATGARLFMNPSTAGTKFPGTQVLNTTLTTGFADLDLSSVVGAMKRVVMLSVTGSATTNVFARQNGDTGDYSVTSPSGNSIGTASVRLNNTAFAYIIVPTDASGIIELKCADAVTTITMVVVAYW